ncbi:MAG: VWA domain-containing protein [Verrucomicrobia bacterium]|nr:VWA domain-containing protein [Verrucomicrobiota bacterium]
MNFHFSHPQFLLLLPVGLAWVLRLAWKSDVQISAWRRLTSLALRLLVLVALVLAIAGLRWMRPQEGLNVFFLLDRSDSVPGVQQEIARQYVNRVAAEKKKVDAGGVLVFGSEAAIEFNANSIVDLKKVQAVVGIDRTDAAAALRLGSAAFPEVGQKRLVLLSDGNENLGDAVEAAQAAKLLGVTIDVLPLGVQRSNDVQVQKLALPARVKQGQTFEAKIFLHSDRPQPAKLRLYQSGTYLGEKDVDLEAGKNLFTFPQTLTEPDLYSYTVQVEAPGDTLPQNNRATAFVNVRGDPQVLLVSSAPDQDKTLAAALSAAGLKVKFVGRGGFPETLEQLSSYDAIFISNLAAGDLGDRLMKYLESAVRDFGVGLVCVGGDQTYAAGGYRGTPLETTLPVNMELDSKKVVPYGAVVLVMHGMEFGNGNAIARDCAIGVLEALGPQDEFGVTLWDGNVHWLFPLGKVGDKAKMRREIAGMNQGDLPNFESIMASSHEALAKSRASLKHIIVFSDGDPGAPTQKLMDAIVADKITVSTVLISGHAGPQTMQWIADQGGGEFHNVVSPADLPQIFIKETMVVLKSAISEEPFSPRMQFSTELTRGFGVGQFPQLQGYVCTTPKTRAELPLLTEKGDPLLAHWQFGLGRAVAFTSDAKARWGRDWVGWPRYRQFWSQVAQWALRRVQNADFTSDVTIDKGAGSLTVEAIDKDGNYRNFLNLQAIVVSPKGERQSVRLEQTGPGRYEARFASKEVGAYTVGLMDFTGGSLQGMQRLGASVDYSPEFSTAEPNLNMLRRIAEIGGGKVLTVPGSPFAGEDVNPFLHDRRKTFQPVELFEWLLKCAILLFPLDVGIRRIQLDREEMLKAARAVRRRLFFWEGRPRPVEADESLAALLARKEAVRSQQARPPAEARPDLFQPQQEGAPLSAEPAQPARAAEPTPATPAKEAGAPPKPQSAESKFDRLLEAKRRAKR